jgi:hypothetical protein
MGKKLSRKSIDLLKKSHKALDKDVVKSMRFFVQALKSIKRDGEGK